MEHDLVIRDATPADRPALVGLMAELQEVERALQPDRAPGNEVADSHLAFLEAEAGRAQGFVLVALRAGAVLGFLVGWAETEGGTYIVERERRFGVVSDLCVTAEARGGGVGSALMAAAEARFQAAGLPVVKVGLLAGNRAADALYRAVGYEDYVVILAKRLRRTGEGGTE